MYSYGESELIYKIFAIHIQWGHWCLFQLQLPSIRLYEVIFILDDDKRFLQ